MTHLDIRTNQCELKVQKVIHLQNLANKLLNTFIDYCMLVGINIEHPVAYTHT